MSLDRKTALTLALHLNQLFHEAEIQRLEMSGQCARRRIKLAVSRLSPIASSTAPGMSTLESSQICSIRQWELAQLLGVSEETVSREIKKLRKQRSTDTLPPCLISESV